MGGDVTQNDDFQKWKTVLKGYNHFVNEIYGSDFDEMIDFQRMK